MKSNKDDEREAIRQYWDGEAARFDHEADHGLRDPVVRAAWQALLARWLPPAPAFVLDVGCGTGSLSVLVAEMGYDVVGIDLSPEMVARAREKARAADVAIPFAVMDASNPHGLPRPSFDVVLCRHLLWALPEPAAVLRRWMEMLDPGGRLLLIEGFWHTGGGLRLPEVLDALPPLVAPIGYENLAMQLELWGEAVGDERFIVIANRGKRAPESD